MPADRRTCWPGFSASHTPIRTVRDGTSGRAGGCAPEIPAGQAERINAVHRGHQMRRAIIHHRRVPRHLSVLAPNREVLVMSPLLPGTFAVCALHCILHSFRRDHPTLRRVLPTVTVLA